MTTFHKDDADDHGSEKGDAGESQSEVDGAVLVLTATFVTNRESLLTAHTQDTNIQNIRETMRDSKTISVLYVYTTNVG